MAVGKASESDGFKSLEALPTAAASTTAKPVVPGALFEDKPQSANDTWRKLHSDPLLLIRQREQEALARVKNNPVQMAMIRDSVSNSLRLFVCCYLLSIYFFICVLALFVLVLIN